MSEWIAFADLMKAHSGVPKQPMDLLARAGALAQIEEDRVFPGLTPAIKYVEDHYIKASSEN